MLFKKKVDSDINLVFLHDFIAKDIFNLIQKDKEYLKTWLPWPLTVKTLENTKDFIKVSIEGFAKGNSMVCAIEYKGKIAGIIGYNTIIPSLKKVEIGYWIGFDFQGKGIITRATKYMTEHAFNELNMEKVEIAVATGNTPSQNVCKRLDFQIEGTIKNAENLHGTIVDHIIFAKYR